MALLPAQLTPSVWLVLALSVLLVGGGLAVHESTLVSRRTMGTLTVIAAVVLVLFGQFLTRLLGSDLQLLQHAMARPFAPAEVLTWSTSSTPSVGYVVRDDSDSAWVTVMLEPDRDIQIRPKSELIGRTVCAITEHDGASRWQLVPRSPSRACPPILNARPRKSLGWRTPAEVFTNQLQSITQASVATTP